MAKGLPYFKFFPTEWMAGDISFESYELQGLFISICALYWQKGGDLSVQDVEKRYKVATAINSLSERFFNVENGKISISFLDEQLTERGHVSVINKANGSKGGKAKAAVAKRTVSERLAKPTNKELELNKNKKKNIVFIPPTIEEVKKYFNENGYSEQAGEKAFKFYNANFWKDSNDKQVKNWKQKMQGVWFKDENKVNPVSENPKDYEYWNEKEGRYRTFDAFRISTGQNPDHSIKKRPIANG